MFYMKEEKIKIISKADKLPIYFIALENKTVYVDILNWINNLY